MTYTINDAHIETQQMFEDALQSTDPEYVTNVAQRLAGAGWEEEADTLRQIARRLSDDEWAYDRLIND